jgi:hypothetical protein
MSDFLDKLLLAKAHPGGEDGAGEAGYTHTTMQRCNLVLFTAGLLSCTNAAFIRSVEVSQRALAFLLLARVPLHNHIPHPPTLAPPRESFLPHRDQVGQHKHVGL